MRVDDIRSAFLQFFAKNDHKVLDSSSLIPQKDPSLLFANAGMVQFKNIFTGLEQPPYKRVATAQKCVRAGGKHNDLENVGYTARHHTFFEMLGNFSFGDYFKEKSIALAWELLTKEYGLKKENILVTVYHNDEEAVTFWKKIARLPDEKIIRIHTADNFWQMGNMGPCGPCTEIFYDHGESIKGGPPGSKNHNGDRFVEIWNLVFMQFNQVTPTNRYPLPKKSVDTGMGLERIATILQGKHDNYAIDTLRNIIEAASATFNTDSDHSALKVIADHMRSMAFLIADNVFPAKDGRGYVLRRIMRRAMRHAHMLNERELLLHTLVPVICKEMSYYTELSMAQSLITETVQLEENRFRETLKKGLSLLEKHLASIGTQKVLSGSLAFTLYDTYGFPLDLTQDILKEKKMTVDAQGFEQAMNKQKSTARLHWVGAEESDVDKVWFGLRKKFGATKFLGYDVKTATTSIDALVKDDTFVPNINQGETAIILTTKTPFYAESGGQVGDSGTFATETAQGHVTATKKVSGDVFLHFITVDQGEIHKGEDIVLTIDGERRSKITINHSATHLLHQALRNRLGRHVTQKGSLQNESLTHFDITHNKALTPEDIEAIEREVNGEIRANTPVITRKMTLEQGRAAGAMALFGEKYGDRVRVVSMGRPTGEKSAYSIELCGGTHVKNTGEIGILKIVAEGAVASGVRRITAITGEAVLAYIRKNDTLLRSVSHCLKTPISDIPRKVQMLKESNKRLDREVAQLRQKHMLENQKETCLGIKVGDITFVDKIADIPVKELKNFADAIKNRIQHPCIVVVFSRLEKKVSLVVVSTCKAHNAVDIAKTASRVLGGKGGGGRPEIAQAGGVDATKIPVAVETIKAQIL